MRLVNMKNKQTDYVANQLMQAPYDIFNKRVMEITVFHYSIG